MGINVFAVLPEYLVSTAETSVDASVYVSSRNTAEPLPRKTVDSRRDERS